MKPFGRQLLVALLSCLEMTYWCGCVTVVVVGVILLGNDGVLPWLASVVGFGLVMACFAVRHESRGEQRGRLFVTQLIVELRREGRLQVVERDSKGRFTR